MERKEQAGRDERRVERHREREMPRFGVLHLAGGIALIGLGALMIVALPDIKRYIRISRM